MFVIFGWGFFKGFSVLPAHAQQWHLGSYNFLIAPSVNLLGISMLPSDVGWEDGRQEL